MTTKFVVSVLCLIMLNMTFVSSAKPSPSTSTAQPVSIDEESTTTTQTSPTSTGTHKKVYESEDEEKFMEMIEDAMKNPKSAYTSCLRSKMIMPYPSMENMTTLE